MRGLDAEKLMRVAPRVKQIAESEKIAE